MVDLLHGATEFYQNVADKYYTSVILTDDAWADLEWWRRALILHVCRPVQPLRGDLLTPMWGDGSGTGTGGTGEHLIANALELDSRRPLAMWMGDWCEFRTLLLSLERASSHRRPGPRPDGILFHRQHGDLLPGGLGRFLAPTPSSFVTPD
jgi:hypothetical protein